MARIVDGPDVSVQVTSKETGAPLAGVTVTVNQTVYTDVEMTSGVTTLVTGGDGSASFYAPPGSYTFTTNRGNANPVEPVEVLGHEEGGGQRLRATFLAQSPGAGSVQGVGLPDVAEKTMFVTPRGNDANDGLTTKSAKLTIAAACTALGASGGRVQLGYGSANSDGASGIVSFPANNVSIRGLGKGISTIVGGLLAQTRDNIDVRDLTIAAPAGTVGLKYDTCTNTRTDGVAISGGSTNLFYNLGAGPHKLIGCTITGASANANLLMRSGSNLYAEACDFTGATSTTNSNGNVAIGTVGGWTTATFVNCRMNNGAAHGLYMLNTCTGIKFIGCEFNNNTLMGANSGSSTSTDCTWIGCDFLNNGDNGYFDGGNCSRMRLDTCRADSNCNAGTNPTGGGFEINSAHSTITASYSSNNGAAASNSDGIFLGGKGGTATDNTVYGNKRCGIYAQATVTSGPYTITGNTVYNNGQNATTPTYGIYLQGTGGSGVQDFTVANNRCYDDQGSKTQTWGIFLGGTIDNGSIRGNDVRGNLTGGLSNGASGKNITISGNPGYNPVGVLGPPAVPATTVALQNPYGVDAAVFISGGTVTAIAIGGNATGLTSGAFRVPAGQTITITYTVAPTWTWFGD